MLVCNEQKKINIYVARNSCFWDLKEQNQDDDEACE